MPLHQSPLLDLRLLHRKFEARDRIKSWLQKYLLARKGINIVTERSDSSKIIFRCKSIAKRDSNGRPVRQTTCPFRIRANYSSRNRCWSIVVINDWHDHELEPHGLLPMLLTSEDSLEESGSQSKKESASSQNPSPATGLGKDANFKVYNSTSADSESKQLELILHLLTNEVNGLIKDMVLENRALSDIDKGNILRNFSNQFNVEYKGLISPPSKVSGTHSWLSTPNTTHSTLNHNPSANLIPLSPLLNESDQEFSESESASANTHPQTLESLSHLPGLNLNLNSNAMQLLLLIQNQAQQLPSFNSIQNQLPFSPTLGMPHSGPTLTATLNPSHLLNPAKSSTNMMAGLNEFKLNVGTSSPAANASSNLFASSSPQSSNTLGTLNNPSVLNLSMSLPSSNISHNNNSTQSMYKDNLSTFGHSSLQHHSLSHITDGW